MSRNRVHWVVTLAVVAFVSSGLLLAGGTGCTKSVEDCAAYYKEKYQTMGWLGVETDKSESGMKTITKVHPGSPAETAGFKKGDHIVSVNGIPYDKESHDQMKAMKEEGKMNIGSQVAYEVKRGSETMTLDVTLAKIPDQVLTAMIEDHKKHEHKMAKK